LTRKIALKNQRKPSKSNQSDWMKRLGLNWRQSANANAKAEKKKREIRRNAPVETELLSAASAHATKADTENYANAQQRKQI